MYRTQQTLAECVKQDILADLQNRNETGRIRENFKEGTHQVSCPSHQESGQYTDRTLVESIKREVLAAMEHRQEAIEQGRHKQEDFQRREMSGEHGMYQQKPRPADMETRQEAMEQNRYIQGTPGERLNRADIERLKREILLDLQEEAGEYQYPPPGYYGTPPAALSPLNPYDQAVLDSVKRELLAGLEMRRAARHAEMYGYGNLVSDRSLNNMIEQRYRTLQNLRGDLRKELGALRAIEKQTASTADPHVKEIARSIVTQAREQGVPLDEVIKSLNGPSGIKENWRQRTFKVLNTGQRKGFLYGIGAAILAAMLYPPARQSLHSVAVRTMEGGMDLADRTRSLVSRAKEGIEDIVAEANFRSLQGELAEDSETPVSDENDAQLNKDNGDDFIN